MYEKKYNVAVSYASEQRSYVERFVKRLHSLKLQVYYDRDEQAQMVGKILDQELHKIYIQQSRHCVLFLSNEYIKKPVTRYESQIILSENGWTEDAASQRTQVHLLSLPEGYGQHVRKELRSHF